jgi:hypothetical protein
LAFGDFPEEHGRANFSGKFRMPVQQTHEFTEPHTLRDIETTLTNKLINALHTEQVRLILNIFCIMSIVHGRRAVVKAKLLSGCKE